MQVETTLNFAREIPCFAIWLFLAYKLKKLLSCLTSPFNLSECNISCKKTFLNLEPNLSYLGIFGLKLEKTTVL